MIGFRGIAAPSQADSLTAGNSVDARTPPGGFRQDSHGPFDGELLDLYVALLIVVPAACFLRSLLF